MRTLHADVFKAAGAPQLTNVLVDQIRVEIPAHLCLQIHGQVGSTDRNRGDKGPARQRERKKQKHGKLHNVRGYCNPRSFFSGDPPRVPEL